MSFESSSLKILSQKFRKGLFLCNRKREKRITVRRIKRGMMNRFLFVLFNESPNLFLYNLCTKGMCHSDRDVLLLFESDKRNGQGFTV